MWQVRFSVGGIDAVTQPMEEDGAKFLAQLLIDMGIDAVAEKVPA